MVVGHVEADNDPPADRGYHGVWHVRFSELRTPACCQISTTTKAAVCLECEGQPRRRRSLVQSATVALASRWLMNHDAEKTCPPACV